MRSGELPYISQALHQALQQAAVLQLMVAGSPFDYLTRI